MNRSRLVSCALGIGLAALVTGSPRTALAQLGDGGSSSGVGISVSGTVYRFTPNGQAYNFRAANLNPNDISFQDCEDNIYLEFTLIESGLPTTDTIEVWAGTTDCSQSTARESATGGPYCWQVAPYGAFANSNTVSGKIYARNITQYIDDTTTTHFTPPTQVPGPAACRTQTTSGSVGISLYFLFVMNDGITADSSTVYGQNVDMVGPAAPTLNLPIGIGDGLLLLNWTPQIDTTIQGFQIFAQDQGPNGAGVGGDAATSAATAPIYCHSGGGTTTCVDSGALADGATSVDASCTTSFADGSAYTEVADSSTLAALTDAELAAMGCQRGGTVHSVTTQPPGGATCTSSVLVDLFTATVTNTATTVDGGTTVNTATDGGTSITTLDGGTIGGTSSIGISQVSYTQYGVGNVGGNTTSSYNVQTLPNGGPLINGHQYAIAVAAYDDDGNVGALSNLGCQTPEPIVDFWDKYSQDGGAAGGGFCSLKAPGAPVAGSVMGLGLGAVAVAMSRRRRRRDP